MKIKYIIISMRLRTLPLSLAGVCLGLLLAVADFQVKWTVILFVLLTTFWIQVLANVCNELGDFLSGTDSAERKGPAYTLTMGLLNKRDFHVMAVVFTVLTIICGVLAIWFSYGTLLQLEPIMLMLLGAAAIMAAVRYTLGRNPYGYRGLGDLYVFLFFGIVSVGGAFFLAAHTMTWLMMLPCVAIGFFSVAVLNVNNIRDIETDGRTRVTIPVKIGERAAKWYQTGLVVGGWICMFAYAAMRIFDPWHYLFVLTLPLYVIHLVMVWKNSGKALDPSLPLLVMSTFALSILGGCGFLVYLIK